MTGPANCPFCSPSPDRLVEENELARAINDAYPVTPGHTLVLPKRHTPSWFRTTPEERTAVFELVDLVQKRLHDWITPDGYNIGINDGRAAGQTVFHVHVHVIPRRAGDMSNPRGGVRGVIPGKRDYHGPGD